MKNSLAISFLSSSGEDEIISCVKLISPPLNDHLSLPASLIPRVSLRSRDRGMQSIRSTEDSLLPSRFLSASRNGEAASILSRIDFTIDLSPILSCSSIGLFMEPSISEGIITDGREEGSGCFNNESCYWPGYLFECGLNIYVRDNGLTCCLYVNVDLYVN